MNNFTPFHKRRHEDDDNYLLEQKERSKRRLIQTFQTLSLNKDSNDPANPSGHFEPHGLDTLSNQSVFNKNTEVINNTTYPTTKACDRNSSNGSKVISKKDDCDYMDTSGPYTVFIPSIDEFLAQEGSSSSGEEEEQDATKQFEDESNLPKTKQKIHTNLAQSPADKNSLGYILDNQDNGYESSSSDMSNQSSGYVSDQSASDMDLDDYFTKSGRKHKNKSYGNNNFSPRNKLSRRGSANKVKKFEIVNRATRDAVMRVPDSVLNSSSSNSISPSSHFALSDIGVSKKYALGRIPDPTSVLSVPGVHHVSSHGFSGSRNDGLFAFYDRPTYELIKYIPKEQVVWEHFAKWMLEKNSAGKNSVPKNSFSYNGNNYIKNICDYNEDMDMDDNSAELNNINSRAYFQHNYDSPTYDQHEDYDYDDDDSMDID